MRRRQTPPVLSLPLLGIPALLLGLCILLHGTAQAGTVPKEGDVLPPLVILAPDQEADTAYLGIQGKGSFGIADIAGEVTLLEFIGVYCPFCHKQAPLFNMLRARLERAKLADRVKMLAVASGATPQEIDYLRQNSGYLFPVLRDQDFSVHAALGQPKTPFTMLVNREGTVLFTQVGVIEDIDSLFQHIREQLK